MLRICTLNINGNANKKLINDDTDVDYTPIDEETKKTKKREKDCFKSLLLNYDVICLTETGKDPIGELPGFQIIQMIRDDNSRHAGVVMLINNDIADSCKVKRMHHSLGIMWLEITLKGHEKVFLAGCYIPHQYSNRHLTSNLKVIDHFNCLNSDIEEFDELGQIIICGDMNSRTGSLEDRPSINVESLSHVGILEDLNNKIAPRVSCDT
jgi:exonuclease III